MSEQTVVVGKHEFKVLAIPLTGGGWTTSTIHTDYSKADGVATRRDSGLWYETEEEALSLGETVARRAASKFAK